MSYNIRKAELSDIPFIVDTIVAAEKSGTDRFGLSLLLGKTEEETRKGIAAMLDEEVEGCEYSIHEFAIAEINGVSAAAFCGWVEGLNEDEQPSSTLKSNLIFRVFGKDAAMHMMQFKELLQSIQLTRTPGALQLEYAFVHPDHRGKGLMDQVIAFLEHRAKASYPELSTYEVQVFANNVSAIRLHERMGYQVVEKAIYLPHPNQPILPFHEKWKMQKGS